MKLTLLDIAERTGSDATIGLIEEVLTVAPELAIIPARTRKGTTYRVTRRTGLPTVGFRKANEGVVPGKSTYKSEAKPMYFFDATLEVDEAIVKAEGGEGDNLGSILADESSGVMQAMGIKMGAQVWLGQSADDDGFLGLNQQIPTGATYTLDATGTGTVGTAWLCWLDPAYKGVVFNIGNSGEMNLGSWARQQVVDSSDATKKLFAWVNNLSFYIGLSTHSQDAVWRIKNITSSKPLTDALAEQLLSKVPQVRRASGALRWFMNPATRFLLQNSRAATGALVGVLYPAVPDTLAGIPIVCTDSIVDGAAY